MPSNFICFPIYYYLQNLNRGNIFALDEDAFRDVTGMELTAEQRMRIKGAREKYSSLIQESIRRVVTRLKVKEISVGDAVSAVFPLINGLSFTTLGNGFLRSHIAQVAQEAFIDIPNEIKRNVCKINECDSDQLIAYLYVVSEVRHFSDKFIVNKITYGFTRFFGHYFPRAMVSVMEFLHPGNMITKIKQFFKDLVPGETREIEVDEKDLAYIHRQLFSFLGVYLDKSQVFTDNGTTFGVNEGYYKVINKESSIEITSNKRLLTFLNQDHQIVAEDDNSKDWLDDKVLVEISFDSDLDAGSKADGKATISIKVIEDYYKYHKHIWDLIEKSKEKTKDFANDEDKKLISEQSKVEYPSRSNLEFDFVETLLSITRLNISIWDGSKDENIKLIEMVDSEPK
ncbi:MAG: hypothetical protein R3B45_15425 [Bdellovibrionota bacterium]